VCERFWTAVDTTVPTEKMPSERVGSTRSGDSFVWDEKAAGQACGLEDSLDTVKEVLFSEHQALDGGGAAGGGVTLDEQAAEPGIPTGRLELSRHGVEEPLNYELFLHTDHAIVWAAHTHIGLVGSAVW
jgi:hypothetical protein